MQTLGWLNPQQPTSHFFPRDRASGAGRRASLLPAKSCYDCPVNSAWVPFLSDRPPSFSGIPKAPGTSKDPLGKPSPLVSGSTSRSRENTCPFVVQKMALMDRISSALTLSQSICAFFCKGMIEGLVVILFIWLLIQVLLDKHQRVHLQVFLGVGLALLCFCLLLGCAICWHRRKKQHHNGGKGQASDQVLVDLTPVLPSRMTAVPIQQQYIEIEGEVLDTPPLAAADSLPGPDSPPKSLLRGRASLPSIPVPQKLSLPSKPTLALERRSTISEGSMCGDASSLLSSPQMGASIPQSYTMPVGLSSAGTKPRPHLHFTLFYSQPGATLTVTVIGVSHLPKGFRASRNSYVKVYLLPKFAEPQRTALRRKSLNPEFYEQFHFGPYCLDELQGLTLRFAVYAKEFCHLKDSFIGEVMFPCSQASWNQDGTFVHTQELSTTKSKLKKCLSSQDVNHYGSSLSQPKSMGQLFLLLQYQALANRIKVLVLKAENLGRLTRMPGIPDHYVMIHLHHNGKVIDTKETKSITGYNPVWNTPFLFNIPAGDIQEQQLSLEFTVMQARLYTRSCAVGRVWIGPDAPELGQVHWKEMCSRGNVESARWHSVQPEGVQLCR